MGELERNLIRKAMQKYPVIYPCGENRAFQDCFSWENGAVVFWYNTVDRSTHIECERVDIDSSFIKERSERQ